MGSEGPQAVRPGRGHAWRLTGSSWGELRTIPPRWCTGNDSRTAGAVRSVRTAGSQPWRGVSNSHTGVAYERRSDRLRLSANPVARCFGLTTCRHGAAMPGFVATHLSAVWSRLISRRPCTHAAHRWQSDGLKEVGSCQSVLSFGNGRLLGRAAARRRLALVAKSANILWLASYPLTGLLSQRNLEHRLPRHVVGRQRNSRHAIRHLPGR